jgi:hypothetical protein
MRSRVPVRAEEEAGIMVKGKLTGMALAVTFLTVALPFFAGCGAARAPKPGADARTVVTLQRRPSKVYADRIMQVFIDDASIPYSLENGGTAAFSVAHGTHCVYVKIGEARSDMVSFNASRSPLSFVASVEKGLFRRPTVIIARSAAAGDTSAVGNAAAAPPAPVEPKIEKALNRAAEAIMKSVQKRLKLAIANVSAGEQHKNLSIFVADRLELLLVNNGYTVVDRNELDRIREEQKFQLSGAVDDGQIVSIGKFAGADVIITGAITESGGAKTLRLRAISIETAQVLSAASERF